MDRQAQDPLRNRLGDRKTARCGRIVRVRLLAMQRPRIVDHRRNTVGLQAIDHAVPVVDLDRVAGPAGRDAIAQARDRHEAAEFLRISLSDARASTQLVVEDLELLDQHRGLHRVHAAVEADADIVVLVAALAMHAQRAPVAVAPQRLGREERRRREVAERTHATIVELAAEALRGIREDPQAVTSGDLLDLRIARRLPEQIDRHHAARPQVGAGDRLDRRLEALRIHVEIVAHHVDEHRRGADQGDHLGAGGEGEGRTEHGIAWTAPLRHQEQEERFGAATTGQRMLDAAIVRELPLERRNFRSEDVLSVLQHTADRGFDLGGDAPPLRLQIDERDRRKRRSGLVGRHGRAP